MPLPPNEKLINYEASPQDPPETIFARIKEALQQLLTERADSDYSATSGDSMHDLPTGGRGTSKPKHD